MNDFPSFMKNKQNLVPAEGQNTEDIKGYFFNGNDGNQVVYRTCYSDQISKQHIHPFDEYMVCIAGQYIGYIEEEEHILNPGMNYIFQRVMHNGENVKPEQEQFMFSEGKG